VQNKVVVKQNQKTLSFLFIGRTLNNTQALSMIKNMSVEERTILLKELKKVETLKEVEIMVPKWTELKQLSYHNSLPFIGFGFLDNFIMIVAGEYIDLTLGVRLGLSTMAAAALGNTISDLMGVGSAWYVESCADKLGARPPDLSAAQLELPRSRVCANLGRAVGIVIGCVLGMFPLIFIDCDPKAEKSL